MCSFFKLNLSGVLSSSKSTLLVALKLGRVPLFYLTTAVIVSGVYVCFVYSIAATTEPSFMNKESIDFFSKCYQKFLRRIIGFKSISCQIQ